MNQPMNFDHYPTLHELGFPNGGVPGIEYAYLAADDMRAAQADGFGAVLGGTGGFFTVTGLKGEVDLQVWGRGRPIFGLDTNQFQPPIQVSDRAEQATGIPRDADEATTPAPAKSKTAAQPSAS